VPRPLVPLLALPLAFLSLLTLAPAALPSLPPRALVPVEVHVSIHCQMDYRGVMPTAGMPGYLVVALHDNPEAGRLGPIQFQVGDVILAVGNHAASADDRLDVLINLAFAEEARTVRVLNPATGEVRLLAF
jgi:hypothetical protein